MLREPVAAGTFYDGKAETLRKYVSSLCVEKKEKISAYGIIVPHAGYVYSGKVAGEVFSSVRIPDTVIILGPNHTGMGAAISVFPEGAWRTPLGDVKIDDKLSADILKNCAQAEGEFEAHLREHSVEVQLPFLQYLKNDFQFAAITLADHDLAHLRSLADAIVKAVKGREVLLIASSDLTHYEDAKTAKQKDSLVLDAIEKMDPEKMVSEVLGRDISMCGWMPAYTVMHACKKLGAKNGKIIRYMNSGDASGDYREVVGYGGAAII